VPTEHTEDTERGRIYLSAACTGAKHCAMKNFATLFFAVLLAGGILFGVQIYREKKAKDDAAALAQKMFQAQIDRNIERQKKAEKELAEFEEKMARNDRPAKR
jgi:predicted negative regulator of RcsB-dependent stress response